MLPGKLVRWETLPCATVPVCAQTWYHERWGDECENDAKRRKIKKERHNWWEGNWTERCWEGRWGAKAKSQSFIMGNMGSRVNMEWKEANKRLQEEEKHAGEKCRRLADRGNPVWPSWSWWMCLRFEDNKHSTGVFACMAHLYRQCNNTGMPGNPNKQVYPTLESSQRVCLTFIEAKQCIEHHVRSAVLRFITFLTSFCIMHESSDWGTLCCGYLLMGFHMFASCTLILSHDGTYRF